MAQNKPYRSNKGNVYHIFADCHTGNNIEKKNRMSGKGNNKLCEHCKKRRDKQGRKKKGK